MAIRALTLLVPHGRAVLTAFLLLSWSSDLVPGDRFPCTGRIAQDKFPGSWLASSENLTLSLSSCYFAGLQDVDDLGELPGAPGRRIRQHRRAVRDQDACQGQPKIRLKRLN